MLPLRSNCQSVCPVNSWIPLLDPINVQGMLFICVGRNIYLPRSAVGADLIYQDVNMAWGQG